MCIEEGLNPLPFHSKFEADFWESVRQSNKTVNTHFGIQVSTSDFNSEDLEIHLFTKMVQKRNLSVKE